MQQLIVSTRSKTRWKLIVPGAFAIICLALMVALAVRWPFRREAVLADLEEVSLSRVEIGAFHGTYFPRPGCVLEQVTFQHNPKPGTPPLMTIERIRIESSFTGLFTKHVKRIRVEGLRILMPPRGTDEHFQAPPRSTFVIDDVIADGAILEAASRDADKQPLTFFFHNFALSNVGSSGPASFRAKLSNPEPPGEITTAGKFGPWSSEDVGKTAVSGEYQFQQADLGVFAGISGLLASSGRFTGELDRIEVEGATEVPNFSVTLSSHQVPLRTQFHALVNAENGDVFLQPVKATFSNTSLWTEGSIAGKSGQSGKTVSLQIAAKEGRIQDILRLFAKSPRSPMSGSVSFKVNIFIPPEQRRFLEKVQLEGYFGIDAGEFTKIETQEGVNHLSAGSLGEQNHKQSADAEGSSENVLSDLRGHVLLKDGMARFSSLSFSIPGALAQLTGTYNLITEKVDLRGTLRTNAEVSKTTHGVKALMLKVLDPFFKKKNAGYVTPVKIAGTYSHPSFGLDLSGRDRNEQPSGSTRASPSSGSRE